ncbi:Elongator subunit ELP6 [Sugiyamaella lignohabitans]|uniref:Elongator subunit ELP6 n=1 Tax=Sugiyamaella lignohabitans TaxID=796027 RepID=A0A167D2H1_9ASCO|nr:Elongator subunit ELP6 [Sugiyamaella lignohabitans]ANB12395.1 Elongator subunit ELP6 [Sugiyamaella lignohabitans]
MAQKFLSVRDLAFFEDGSIELSSGEGSDLCLVTSSLEVAPTWLVDTVCGRHVSNKTSPTVLITFTERSNIHIKGIKRYSGSDVSHVPKSVFSIVDLSSSLFANGSKTSGDKFVPTNLDSLVEIVAKSITTSRGAQDGSQLKPLIIIEEPDVLLATGLYTWDQVSRFIYDLRQLSSQTFVFANADEPLIQPVSPIGENQVKFLTQLIHTSSLLISLRPFETGRADDVTGIFRITRGPRVNETKVVVENEYLYHVSDTVKLMYR